MPVMPMTFQILTPDQANPLGYGLKQGSEVANNWMQARNQAIQNRMLQAQLPYAGDMAQADLALKQAQAPYVQSQTAINEGTVPYLGMKFGAAYMNAQTKAAQAAIANANSYRNYAQTPEGQKLLQTDPKFQESFINAMNNASSFINSGFGFNANAIPGSSGAPNQVPATNQTNPSMPSSDAIASALRNNYQVLPQTPQQTQRLNQLFGQPPSSQDMNAVQQASSDAYYNKMLPVAQRQQVTYENVVDGLLRDNQPIINDAATFAGLAGKANQTAEKYAQSAGLNSSQQYQNYVTFVNQIAPKISNELRRAYGGQATDHEQKLMADISNPVKWTKDPQQVFSEFNQLVSDLRTNAREIVKTPSQAISTLNQNVMNPPTFGAKQNTSRNSTTTNADRFKNYTDADWQHTAQKHGITVQQAKQLAGAQ